MNCCLKAGTTKQIKRNEKSIQNISIIFADLNADSDDVDRKNGKLYSVYGNIVFAARMQNKPINNICFLVVHIDSAIKAEEIYFN